MAKLDVTVRQTPHVFSDSLGIKKFKGAQGNKGLAGHRSNQTRTNGLIPVFNGLIPVLSSAVSLCVSSAVWSLLPRTQNLEQSTISPKIL